MTHNVDLDEISKFGNLADKWWNKAGELKTLHDINPVRLAFIEEYEENLVTKRFENELFLLKIQ